MGVRINMKIKKIITNLSLVIGILCLTSTGVQAMSAKANLLNYDGTGIWSWRSVNDFSLNSSQKVTVFHNQVRNTASSSTTLNVAVRKYAGIGSTLQFDDNFKGDSKGSFSGTLSSGKYFLRFESSVRAAKFDIWGSVY